MYRCNTARTEEGVDDTLGIGHFGAKLGEGKDESGAGEGVCGEVLDGAVEDLCAEIHLEWMVNGETIYVERGKR